MLGQCCCGAATCRREVKRSRSASGAQWRSSFSAASTPLVNTASGGASISTYGGAASSSPAAAAGTGKVTVRESYIREQLVTRKGRVASKQRVMLRVDITAAPSLLCRSLLWSSVIIRKRIRLRR